MESTTRQPRSGQRPRRRWFVGVVVILAIASLSSPPALHAQDATEAPETPDVVVPGTGEDTEEIVDEASPETLPDAEPTAETADPAAADETDAVEPVDDPESSSSGVVIQVSATDTGHPAVLAHGLAFLTGDQSVWQVREVEPAGSFDAESTVSNAAFVLQVAGTSVIRNDVTGKRALLSPGEVYFKSGGDAYTTFDDSGDSIVWIFEVVEPDVVAEDAFYESPLIGDYEEGVFDLQIIRFVLEPGETATLPDHTGPALVLSTDGDVDIEADDLGLLGTGDGQLVTVDATVTNNSSNPATFMMTAFGSEVGDVTASPDPGDAATSDDPAASDAAAVDSPSLEDDTTADDATTADETTTEDTTVDSGEDSGGVSETSINITALSELYVVIVADGVTVFDGPIPEGGQSGVIVGSSFDVYTSYGADTLFTNACGDEYYMGYEEGEAQYTLTSNANSCPP